MEILIILLLLSLVEKNDDLKETLQTALKFYKENRELLRSLCEEEKKEVPKEKKREQDENRSSFKLIEQFLNRQ